MALFSKQHLSRIEAAETRPVDRPCVMLVDDREANLAVMSAILRPHYTLLEAHDGQEALEMIAGLEQPGELACLIADYRMPGLSGVELMQKARPMLQWTMRIIVSGFIDLDAIIESINRAEIHKFIAKPCDAGEFLAAVGSAVDAFEVQRQRARRQGELEQKVRQLEHELALLRQGLPSASA